MKLGGLKTCDVKNHIRGLLLGFATGDAMGAPAAGLPGRSFLQRNGPIRGFTVNPNHPYFSQLGLGCFTENTRLLLDAALDYAKVGDFDEATRKNTLISWAERVIADGDAARWPGTTTLNGAFALRAKIVARGSERDSVGATYRCLPIAVVAEPQATFVAQVARL